MNMIESIQLLSKTFFEAFRFKSAMNIGFKCTFFLSSLVCLLCSKELELFEILCLQLSLTNRFLTKNRLTCGVSISCYATEKRYLSGNSSRYFLVYVQQIKLAIVLFHHKYSMLYFRVADMFFTATALSSQPDSLLLRLLITQDFQCYRLFSTTLLAKLLVSLILSL